MVPPYVVTMSKCATFSQFHNFKCLKFNPASIYTPLFYNKRQVHIQNIKFICSQYLLYKQDEVVNPVWSIHGYAQYKGQHTQVCTV